MKKLFFVPVFVLMTSCAYVQMNEEDLALDTDLPLPVVARYKACKDTYVDKGKLYFFPLELSETKIWKTAEGFCAREEDILLLGLLSASICESKFDAHGRLVEHQAVSEFFLGLFPYSEISVQNGARSRETWYTSILWGAFAREGSSDGHAMVRLLWIPITYRCGEKQPSP